MNNSSMLSLSGPEHNTYDLVEVVAPGQKFLNKTLYGPAQQFGILPW